MLSHTLVRQVLTRSACLHAAHCTQIDSAGSSSASEPQRAKSSRNAADSTSQQHTSFANHNSDYRLGRIRNVLQTDLARATCAAAFGQPSSELLDAVYRYWNAGQSVHMMGVDKQAKLDAQQ